MREVSPRGHVPAPEEINAVSTADFTSTSLGRYAKDVASKFTDVTPYTSGQVRNWVYDYIRRGKLREFTEAVISTIKTFKTLSQSNVEFVQEIVFALKDLNRNTEALGIESELPRGIVRATKLPAYQEPIISLKSGNLDLADATVRGNCVKAWERVLKKEVVDANLLLNSLSRFVESVWVTEKELFQVATIIHRAMRKFIEKQDSFDVKPEFPLANSKQKHATIAREFCITVNFIVERLLENIHRTEQEFETNKDKILRCRTDLRFLDLADVEDGNLGQPVERLLRICKAFDPRKDIYRVAAHELKLELSSELLMRMLKIWNLVKQESSIDLQGFDDTFSVDQQVSFGLLRVVDAYQSKTYSYDQNSASRLETLERQAGLFFAVTDQLEVIKINSHEDEDLTKDVDEQLIDLTQAFRDFMNSWPNNLQRMPQYKAIIERLNIVIP